MAKNEDNWHTFFTELQAYIEAHGHLPPKNASLGAKYLLNWSKYVRKTIKEGTCDEWKREMFESLMAERHLDEHTGGRKKSSNGTPCFFVHINDKELMGNKSGGFALYRV